MRTQQVQVVPPRPRGSESDGAGSWLVLAPVTERGEAIGVLELTLPDRPDAAAREEIARLAHLLAFVVIANRRHTDLYEWGQRSRPLSLSAEIQHRLLPGPRRARRGRSPSRAGSSPLPSSPGTRSTSAWRATCCTCP